MLQLLSDRDAPFRSPANDRLFLTALPADAAGSDRAGRNGPRCHVPRTRLDHSSRAGRAAPESPTADSTGSEVALRPVISSTCMQ